MYHVCEYFCNFAPNLLNNIIRYEEDSIDIRDVRLHLCDDGCRYVM